jgi:hypothetical protein
MFGSAHNFNEDIIGIWDISNVLYGMFYDT